MVRLAVACIALGLALGAAGCHQGAPPSPRSDAAGPVAADAEAAGGPGPGMPAGLPGDLPRDLPIYPGAVTVEATRPRGRATSLVFEAQETPEKVAAFYRRRLLAGGWSLDGEMTVEGEYVLVASKQARRASALVSDQEGRTRITLTLTRND
jgi:hypothetical protein